MKNKKIITIFITIFILLLIGFLFYENANKYNGNYEIKVEKIDNNSPDRHLKVLKNGTETEKYKYIAFKENKDIILCYQTNATVNVFELDNIDELIVVLPNDKEVIARVIKEEI